MNIGIMENIPQELQDICIEVSKEVLRIIDYINRTDLEECSR